MLELAGRCVDYLITVFLGHLAGEDCVSMVDLWVPEKGGSGCALGGDLGAGRASS